MGAPDIDFSQEAKGVLNYLQLMPGRIGVHLSQMYLGDSEVPTEKSHAALWGFERKGTILIVPNYQWHSSKHPDWRTPNMLWLF